MFHYCYKIVIYLQSRYFCYFYINSCTAVYISTFNVSCHFSPYRYEFTVTPQLIYILSTLSTYATLWLNVGSYCWFSSKSLEFFRNLGCKYFDWLPLLHSTHDPQFLPRCTEDVTCRWYGSPTLLALNDLITVLIITNVQHCFVLF